MKLIKKMVGWGYQLLGMPYQIVVWTLKKIYTVLNELLSYLGKGTQLLIGTVLKTLSIIWKIVKLPFPWSWKQLKKIKPKAMVKWLIDVIKESIAQIFTLLGFYIAWFTLTGSAQDIVGIAIVISTIIWLLTIRLRD